MGGGSEVPPLDLWDLSRELEGSVTRLDCIGTLNAKLRILDFKL